MAEFQWWAGPNQVHNLAGSGLGFYGSAGFGASVEVNKWQGRTFITDATGTAQGPEANNVQFLNSQSGILGQTGSGIHLTHIPNGQASFELRFVNDVPVQVQNVQLRIYDRNNPNNPASGVTTALAQIIHPDPTQGAGGSGNALWVFPGGSGTVLNLAPSPGVSGLYAGNGSDSTRPDTSHSWFVAASASPDQIGSITQYGAYAQAEFL